MNSSLRTADVATHLKIVVVSLIAAIVVVMVGITALVADSRSTTFAIQMDRSVVKLSHIFPPRQTEIRSEHSLP